MRTIGFLGCGNMGGALAAAVAASVGGDCVLLCDRDTEKAELLASKISARTVTLSELASAADCIFLGVKPQVFPSALSELSAALNGRKLLFVTMAAGLSISAVSAMLSGARVIRIMPNTPAAVGEGMILYAAGEAVTEQEMSFFLSALSGAGRLLALPEDKIDAASAVSGCGPAFAYLFIEALADAGVECGLARTDALVLAEQMLLGSAKLALDSGSHPAELKDAVCSPGGTTIAGVHALENGAFRAAVMDAVFAAYKRTLELKK